MNKKVAIFGIIGAIVVIVGVLVACSGHNDTTAQNPPAQSSAPNETISSEVTPDPVPEIVSPEPEKEPEKEPEQEPVVTDTPEVSETPEPSVEPEPVVTPEPTPEPVVENVTSDTNTGTSTGTTAGGTSYNNPHGAPVPDTSTDNKNGPDESNTRVEQEAQQAQQSASTQYTYPPNSTTEGLTAYQIQKGYYIDKATGDILDQNGRYHGQYGGWAPEDANGNPQTEEEQRAEDEANQKVGESYGGDGAYTGNFNN